MEAAKEYLSLLFAAITCSLTALDFNYLVLAGVIVSSILTVYTDIKYETELSPIAYAFRAVFIILPITLLWILLF